MPEIQVTSPGSGACDDDQGKRGKRGHQGPTGPTGPSGGGGLTGPTGPTGSSQALFPPTALIEGDFAVTMFKINQIDPNAFSSDVTGTLPAANSVQAGAWAMFAVSPEGEGGDDLNIATTGGDTINTQASPLVFTFDGDTLWLMLVSDGISNWVIGFSIYH